eukprot:PhF_6_TR35024/c1_g1_i2/m.51014
MRLTQHIEGLTTFMDLSKLSNAIIPLTMTDVMQWYSEENDVNIHVIERDMHVVKQVIRKIQRLEPFEYQQLETNCASTLLLHAAAWSGHDEFIRRLLSIDPTMIKVLNDDGESALHSAAHNGHYECIRTLLCIDPEMTKVVAKDGNSALHVAARNGHDECIRTLLSYDSTMINMLNANGESALHEAAYNGHYECIRTLL